MIEITEPIFDYHLRIPPGKSDMELPGQNVQEKIQQKLKEDDDGILCRQCHQMITRYTERTTIAGSHQHTFANPIGIVFQIGCFRSAVGCGYSGSLTEDFSWFKGFSWRIAVCSACLIQLGWQYMSGSGESFHGLILNRLVTVGKEDFI